jgi:hypothetical protein
LKEIVISAFEFVVSFKVPFLIHILFLSLQRNDDEFMVTRDMRLLKTATQCNINSADLTKILEHKNLRSVEGDDQENIDLSPEKAAPAWNLHELSL